MTISRQTLLMIIAGLTIFISFLLGYIVGGHGQYEKKMSAAPVIGPGVVVREYVTPPADHLSPSHQTEATGSISKHVYSASPKLAPKAVPVAKKDNFGSPSLSALEKSRQKPVRSFPPLQPAKKQNGGKRAYSSPEVSVNNALPRRPYEAAPGQPRYVERPYDSRRNNGYGSGYPEERYNRSPYRAPYSSGMPYYDQPRYGPRAYIPPAPPRAPQASR